MLELQTWVFEKLFRTGEYCLAKPCKREIVGYSIRSIRGYNNTSIAFIFFFRKPPAGHEKDRYSLSITVNGEPLGGGHPHTYCWGICKFWVSFSLLYHDSHLQQVCCKVKPISGCVHIACFNLMITSLLQVVNRIDAS